MVRLTAAPRWVGMQLALLALLIQAAIPGFIASDFAAAAEQSAALQTIETSLCLHDGGSPSSDPAPHHTCPPLACPLCAAMATVSAAAPPADPPALAPPHAASPIRFAELESAPDGATPAAAYRSRAPPLA